MAEIKWHRSVHTVTLATREYASALWNVSIDTLVRFVFVGDLQRATEQYKLGLCVARETGDLRSEGHLCYSLGSSYTLLRNHPSATQFQQRHLEIATSLKDKVHIPLLTNQLLTAVHRPDVSGLTGLSVIAVPVRSDSGRL